MIKPKIKRKFCNSHQSRRGMKPKYIVIHWVGGMGTAQNNLDYFARVNPTASAHYFVDAKMIGQSVPLDRGAWAVGGRLQDFGHQIYYGNRGATLHGKVLNNNSISIELCCTKQYGKMIVDPRAIERAIPLVRWLMAEFKIPAKNVVRHFDVTGKYCPGGYCGKDNWAKLHKTLTGAK